MKKRIVVAVALAFFVALFSSCTGALVIAARYGHNPKVISTLLKAGADINFQSKNGMTPLMYAAARQPEPRGDRHAPERPAQRSITRTSSAILR